MKNHQHCLIKMSILKNIVFKASFLIKIQAASSMHTVMMNNRCKVKVIRVVRMMQKTNPTLFRAKAINLMFRNHRTPMEPTRFKIRVMMTCSKKLMSIMKLNKTRVASPRTWARSKTSLKQILKFRSTYRIKSQFNKISYW